MLIMHNVQACISFDWICFVELHGSDKMQHYILLQVSISCPFISFFLQEKVDKLRSKLQ